MEMREHFAVCAKLGPWMSCVLDINDYSSQRQMRWVCCSLILLTKQNKSSLPFSDFETGDPSSYYCPVELGGFSKLYIYIYDTRK